MAFNWKDLAGTVNSFFRIGVAGVRLKNLAGHLGVRNANDTADANITAAKVLISGDSIDLNSDSAGTGADRKYTLARPAAGMTGDVVLTLPVDDGSAGQVMQTDGLGNSSWVSAGSTQQCETVDTTSLAFGAGATTAMFSLPANAVVLTVEVIIDTAFNGTPSLSIGITGSTSKYMGAADLDLTSPPASNFEVSPNLPAIAAAEALIATYAIGAATVGAARILVTYAVPQ